jgi:hypothetical protein
MPDRVGGPERIASLQADTLRFEERLRGGRQITGLRIVCNTEKHAREPPPGGIAMGQQLQRFPGRRQRNLGRHIGLQGDASTYHRSLAQ